MQANIKALFATLEKHEVVNIACGDMTSLNQLWKMISASLEVDLPAKYGPQRTGDIKHSLASIEKAEKLFSYKPYIDMKAGLKKTIEWGKMNVGAL